MPVHGGRFFRGARRNHRAAREPAPRGDPDRAILIKSPRRALILAVISALLPIAAFLVTNRIETGSFRPVQSRFSDPSGPYHYVGSYWNHPQGLDTLHEPAGIYAMHMLVGHHGFFLLMPVLLVGLVGAGVQFAFAGQARPLLALFVLAATAIFVCFTRFTRVNRRITAGATRARAGFSG